MKRHWVTQEEKEKIWQAYLKNRYYYKRLMRLYEDIGKLTGHKWQAIAKVIWKKQKENEPLITKNQLKLF